MDFLISTIGKYISSTPTEVTEEEGYIVVYFTATFEQEENVTVRVVFKEGDNTHKVKYQRYRITKRKDKIVTRVTIRETLV